MAALLLVLTTLPGTRPATAQELDGVVIASVSPTDVQWADRVTVTGEGFGDAYGSVVVGGVRVRVVLEWTDTSITFTVPSSVEPGPADVVVQPPGRFPATASAALTVRNYLVPKGGEIVPGLVRIRLRPDALPTGVATRWDLELPELAYPDSALGTVLRRYFDVRVPEGEEAAYIVRLAADPDVEWANAEHIGRAADVAPNDTYYVNDTQWGPQHVGASRAWAYTKGAGATIAIVDSGVNTGHADLASKLLAPQTTKTDETGTIPADGCGHGTHVAGIAAAATHNARGVAGMGWQAPFRSYKVLRGDCTMNWGWVTSAVYDAIGHGVRVINMSIGDEDSVACTPDLQTQLDRAANAGIFTVVSAGNSGNNDPGAVADCNNVFVVANTDWTNAKALDSDFGTWVDLSAPGEGIYSTAVAGAPQCGAPAGTGYQYCSGTSMAAPHVAGTAALLYAGGATRAQVISYLTSKATPLTSGVCGLGQCGAGLLNAAESLRAQEYARISGYASRGCCMSGDPAPASWAANHLDTYIRGTDNALWHKWWTGSAWTGWELLGGTLTSSPAAVAWGPGRMDVFVRGTDNKLWQKFYTGSWSVWLPLGAPSGGLTSGPDASSWGVGRLDVVVRGGDGNIWQKFHDGTWSGWLSLGAPPGGASGDPAITSWSAGRVDVFVRGTADNALWHRFYNGSWSGWERLGGELQGSPAATSWAPGRIDVFVRGTDNAMWRLWWDGSFWSHWDSWGPTIASGPGVIDWGAGRLDVFARGTDAHMYHKFRS